MKKAELLNRISALVSGNYGHGKFVYENNKGAWVLTTTDMELWDNIRHARRSGDDSDVTLEQLLVLRHAIIIGGTKYDNYNDAFRSI